MDMNELFAYTNYIVASLRASISIVTVLNTIIILMPGINFCKYYKNTSVVV